MTSYPRTTESWVSVGSSELSPVENKQRAQVEVSRYYVVVGFEVNKPNAFANEIHDLAIDYGHAFVYLVENLSIKSTFSFGPAGAGKVGWFNKGKVMTSKKNGSSNGRPATADYFVTELVRAFQISVSRIQAALLEQEIKKLRLEIYTGATEYSALMNDTCAETAKEVLDEAGVETPSGSGWVKHSGMLKVPFVYAVNPCKWHKNLKARFNEATFNPGAGEGWIPVVGENDPIFSVPKSTRSDAVVGTAR